MLKTIKISTKNKQEIIDITEKIKKIIAESKIKKGICIISSSHTTTGILINEINDKKICKDIIHKLEEIIPELENYNHCCNRKNAHAHIKTSLIGNSKTIIIQEGELLLGKWQGIGVAEFDGPRKRRIMIKIIKG